MEWFLAKFPRRFESEFSFLCKILPPWTIFWTFVSERLFDTEDNGSKVVLWLGKVRRSLAGVLLDIRPLNAVTETFVWPSRKGLGATLVIAGNSVLIFILQLFESGAVWFTWWFSLFSNSRITVTAWSRLRVEPTAMSFFRADLLLIPTMIWSRRRELRQSSQQSRSKSHLADKVFKSENQASKLSPGSWILFANSILKKIKIRCYNLT